jgi:succinyl-CoA synthetase beta subunit
MKIHEYQAKAVLQKFGVPVPAGVPLLAPDQVAAVTGKLPPPGPWVVKSQVHTGGRGKAGGILMAKTPEEVGDAAKKLFGKKLVTHQTGPEGLVVNKLYVEQAQTVERELYMACVIDRAKGRPVMMASMQGGMDVEELSRTQPEAILFEDVDPRAGLEAYRARSLARRMGLEGAALVSVAAVAQSLAKAFIGYDGSILEINPLGLTKEGKAIAMDAKMTIDDNALFRHPDAQAWRDPSEENPLDVRASQAGVNYIALEGTIGCLVNGAGLAMGTMDLIKYHGGDPANFLDVGGGANQQQVTEAFRIIVSDKKVKGILVNIFGGIMKCDIIANGIIAAAKEVGLQLPLVVRLEGTNVEDGRRILQESGLKLEAVTTLTEAADKIVAASRGNS